MTVPAYYPFKSAALREAYFAEYDAEAARDWPADSEARMVPTSYGATFVRIGGPAGAPPLVLLPGAGATSLMWAPNIRALSEHYRTYAVDQVDQLGRSECTRPTPTLSDMLTWLNELFDALDLHDGVNLAGLSYGGALTAQFALHHPERLSRAILLAPGNTVLSVTIEFYVRLFLGIIIKGRFLRWFAEWIFADMLQKDPRWVDASISQIFTFLRILDRRKTPILPVLTDAQWGAWRVPALFMVGEREAIYSAERAAQRLRRVAPQIATEVIPGSGHDFTFAHPAEVNRRMLEFLAQPVAAR